MKTKKGKAHSYKYVVSSSGYWQITVYFCGCILTANVLVKPFYRVHGS